MPNDAKESAPATSNSKTVKSPAPPAAGQKTAVGSKPTKVASAITIDTTKSPTDFWNAYFDGGRADERAVRETVRQLMGKKQLDQVIALINAALRKGQPQSWMYESLGIAMELNGNSKSEIERTIMSAADFSTSPDELMYIAQYLSRLGLDRRAMLVCQHVAKVALLRGEKYALDLCSAEQSCDLAGVRWGHCSDFLSQACAGNIAEI